MDSSLLHTANINTLRSLKDIPQPLLASSTLDRLIPPPWDLNNIPLSPNILPNIWPCRKPHNFQLLRCLLDKPHTHPLHTARHLIQHRSSNMSGQEEPRSKDTSALLAPEVS